MRAANLYKIIIVRKHSAHTHTRTESKEQCCGGLVSSTDTCTCISLPAHTHTHTLNIIGVPQITKQLHYLTVGLG